MRNREMVGQRSSRRSYNHFHLNTSSPRIYDQKSIKTWRSYVQMKMVITSPRGYAQKLEKSWRTYDQRSYDRYPIFFNDLVINLNYWGYFDNIW